MPAKQERIRIDIWSSLRPVIEAEVERSGLTAQEVVNIALVDYFGLSPSGKKLDRTQSEAKPHKPSDDNSSNSEFYLQEYNFFIPCINRYKVL